VTTIQQSGTSGAARTEILGRIRAALRDVPTDEQPADVPVARNYLQTSPLTRDAQVDLFVERVEDYKAIVHRISAADLPAAIASAVGQREARLLAVPDGLPAEWRPTEAELLADAGQLTSADLDGTDGVITGCAAGIAETGTIVLDAGPTQGRRMLTLVPDYHLCVVFADQVVGTVPEAIARLDGTRPTTFISGPSATSDIELSRVEGVHGPRTLEVLLVE
jgi:L-lactate dehydrogenase complex protein LldG